MEPFNIHILDEIKQKYSVFPLPHKNNYKTIIKKLKVLTPIQYENNAKNIKLLCADLNYLLMIANYTDVKFYRYMCMKNIYNYVKFNIWFIRLLHNKFRKSMIDKLFGNTNQVIHIMNIYYMMNLKHFHILKIYRYIYY